MSPKHFSVVEGFSAAFTYFLLLSSIPAGILATIYVLFYTQYWYFAVIYLFWIWIIDADTPNGTGRRSNWVQSWSVFKHTTNYFPINVDREGELEADLQKNYMACCFPHGVMPTGAMMGFLTNALNMKQKFPHHKVFGVALNGLFHIPFYRDFILSLGLCNANASTIEKILSHPTERRILGIIIGGAAEMFYYEKDVYRVVLKNRKGFIKMALKTGTSLVPVFSFGETRIYKQIKFEKGTFLRRLQEWSKVIIGFPIVLFYGRGLFQEVFGMVPLKSPINLVIGTPIDVQKIQDPTESDIDTLHEIFVKKLVALFEKYKYLYEPNPEKCQLIIC